MLAFPEFLEFFDDWEGGLLRMLLRPDIYIISLFFGTPDEFFLDLATLVEKLPIVVGWLEMPPLALLELGFSPLPEPCLLLDDFLVSSTDFKFLSLSKSKQEDLDEETEFKMMAWLADIWLVCILFLTAAPLPWPPLA